jgi:hypothetical protein
VWVKEGFPNLVVTNDAGNGKSTRVLELWRNALLEEITELLCE